MDWTRGVALSAAMLIPSAANARPTDWDKMSGIGRDLLVGAALGVPAVQGDWRGDVQAGESLLAAGGSTFILKELIHERRPDGTDNRSFPSGHTSISFAAAATLEKRYGWQAGLPALVIATFVGVARVQANKHHAHDVLSGALIGGISGFLLTDQRTSYVRLAPWAEHDGGGIDMTFRF